MAPRQSDFPGLSSRVTSRTIGVTDLSMHILEAAPENSAPDLKPPLILLLHGFPELAYSWRNVIVPLADAGFRVVAPDQRGYGRTTIRNAKASKDAPWEHAQAIKYDDPLAPFRMLSLVTDIVALVEALGYTEVAAVVGHDFGSMVAGHCALIRPDVFRAVVMMSAPFTGTPSLSAATSSVALPSGAARAPSLPQLADMLLSKLTPPRKHYTMYFSSPEAAEDMAAPPQGLHAFLRAYFHVKSGDWEANQPHRLASMTAQGVAVMPHYYIMPREASMPAVAATQGPSSEEIIEKSLKWLPDDELAVYVSEYSRTGFQGGLNWYRCATDNAWSEDLLVFSRKRIEVPAMFLAGQKDWGVYQIPGAAEVMRDKTCARMDEEDFVLVEGAGHWVQQEASKQVVEQLVRFIGKANPTSLA
ncbi:hypothetical protein HGRIS_011329 [Hohenbuehelia grisea]|uniref:AB hydrolase-1 domain-containing protein n=1 Tax=Hohenbuehelia grisea TaxID=104357 RepID=A0ABR3JUW3_9AGAR